MGLLFALVGPLPAERAVAQTEPPTEPPATERPAAVKLTCASKLGERQYCPANTTAGVLLARSLGEAPCLLGKSWGYDDAGVWVSDGCVADFIVAAQATTVEPEAAEPGAAEPEATPPPTKDNPEYVPLRRFPALPRASWGRSICGCSATRAT